MKRILIACGSGVCTSTAARMKVEKILDDNGYNGQYKIEQCKIAEVPSKSVNFDFVIATTMKPDGVKCPFVNGMCFLTGIGIDKAANEILELMKK
ncbi:PTS sugar transporter subunit IIB [Thermoanaerobacterium thermosaccharolyticum]|uniref:PTS galactitol transporter subunit IIB n=1 Tax=Thermoanaerobacterium thermosaccharolyticum TaxID=1517 RepID=A0A231VCS3_THETR|nr:PTS sugar transporter subunit IIB [Thermoanaerobacterium thermosaccharolyticum]OXT05973.1 PTS galactitol transporter subunit IIB [Thermoanaerobacterium thermosaccharolyticum]